MFTCSSVTPPCVTLVTNNPRASGIHVEPFKLRHPFTRISLLTSPCSDKIWMGLFGLRTNTNCLPSGESASDQSFTFGSSPIRATSAVLPFNGSKAMLIACLRSSVRSAIAHSLDGDLEQPAQLTFFLDRHDLLRGAPIDCHPHVLPRGIRGLAWFCRIFVHEPFAIWSHAAGRSGQAAQRGEQRQSPPSHSCGGRNSSGREAGFTDNRTIAELTSVHCRWTGVWHWSLSS